MISVAEAKKQILQNSSPLQPIFIELENAVGFYLAEGLYAIDDIPAFNQSAMDGYACSIDANSINENFTTKYTITDSIKAGADLQIDLQANQCVRIYTGAAVPDSANTVIMQEKTVRVNNQIQIVDDAVFIGKNIRPKGSELKTGDLLLQKNSFLNAASIGLLASAGLKKLPVYPKPRIAIITTGSELQTPGNDLKNGQIYEANSFALKAALKQMHVLTEFHIHVADNLEETTKAIEAALQVADIILITGGISVGDYDFVKEATSFCQVKPIFHKISQKPGKPLFYGIKNKQLIFGIPGNPAAVLTCFYEYVRIAINQLMGNPNHEFTKIQRPLANKFYKKLGVAVFLKGFYNEKEVRILGAQESYRLSSFATANCLIYLPEEITEVNQHDMVEVHIIPQA
jgi:molybdopterin molybdotransferase